jgi:hypothetical protein
MYQVFLSYGEGNQEFVAQVARRLQGEAHISFWFAPWHQIPGRPSQEQAEAAFAQSRSCTIFVGGGEGVVGWQNREMREAIRKQVEETPEYRVIPVFVPGTRQIERDRLPVYLKHYFRPGLEVAFTSPDDSVAFLRLVAGILNRAPHSVSGYLQAERERRQLPPPSGGFTHGHALVMGVAEYARATSLPASVRCDALALARRLRDPMACGYPPCNVTQLLDSDVTGAGMRAALGALAQRAGLGDTAVVYFSGHGAHNPGEAGRQYLLPYDCDPDDLPGTALAGDEMTALLEEIQAERLLVLFDSCHSGGVGDPKGPLLHLARGLDEGYYEALAQGKGRVVMASSRPDELSWTLPGMPNSLFTHYVLEALAGKAATLGDGYVRVFDVFRHVAARVPKRAAQHPVFKATALEEDFPIALAR